MIIPFPTPNRTTGLWRLIVRGFTNKQRLLSTEEIAEILGVPILTVTEWANKYRDTGGSEGIPGFKLGKRNWSFDPEQVQAWLSSKESLPEMLGGRGNGTRG